MNKVITVGREFGSGGRELGRRLAEELGVEYYDQEILGEIVKRTNFVASYIREVDERMPHALYPITVGKTLLHIEDYSLQQAQEVFQKQSQILRELAEKSDCVIVGRCADYVLREFQPYRIFVYASMESRLQRCRARMRAQETWSDEELKRQIRRIDRRRAKYYEFHTERTWGDKKNYDLCINTSRLTIKDFISASLSIFK